MGRTPPVAHQAFDEAFLRVLRTRVPDLPQNASPRDAIALFHSLSKQDRQGFWPALNKILGVTGDWSTKHFSNCYQKHAYSGDIKRYHKVLIDCIAQAYHEEGPDVDQKTLRESCKKLVEGKDIFPIAVDNLVYHVVKGLRSGERQLANRVPDPKDTIVLKPLFSNPPEAQHAHQPAYYGMNDPIINQAIASLEMFQANLANSNLPSLNLFSANYSGAFW
ncbi:hypothetical protein SS50377_22854 [Spironucleus salmonicida]|uniref:Uncharacterized protein n=1 Tax=Spironucleus salmonicida TaxID=348837 RepID=V6LTD9_9EUKA|nr:hypothetical protein SS50377_22854 [Spironucleus salmonicida]|eukprot:EST47912.1 Hypothetical protein SS50377_12018 [Spironucleus salmonicida]